MLEAFALAKTGRGRRAYVEWLELRAGEGRGRLSDEAMRAMRKGWYLGEDSFRDKLLALLEKGAKAVKTRGSHTGSALQDHGEAAAEKIVQAGLALWVMPDGEELRGGWRKSDARKVAMAMMIKQHTDVSNFWIAERLGMGRDRSVSRLVKEGKMNHESKNLCRALEKMLPRED